MLPGRFATNQHPDYEILGEISRGGMGVVLRARQREIGRICALKLIAIEASENDQARLLKRFEIEAQALSLFQHRNIVTLFSYAYEAHCPYIVMEHVDGQTLDALVQTDSQSLDGPGLIDTFMQVAEALAYCHDKGVIHRDVKPSNILVAKEANGKARPVLVDFGITKAASQTISRTADGISLTGELIGTPVYMSPEQLDPDEFGEVSDKTDVWGLGVTLYQCLTGVLPFQAPSAVGTLKKIYLDHPHNPITLNSETPKWLGALVLNCLAKDPAERPNMSDIVLAFKQKTFAGAPSFSLGKVLAPVLLLLTLISVLFGVYGVSQTDDVATIRLIQFDIPPAIIDKAQFRLVGQISHPHVKFQCGSETGVSDAEGRIEGLVTLPEGKNVLSLQVFQDKRWVELRSVGVQVDTQKPKLNVLADFANVCILDEGQSISMIVDDDSTTEWKIDDEWRTVGSNRIIKLFADPNQIERIVQVRDSGGHSTTLKLNIVSHILWRKTKKSLNSLQLWKNLPQNQMEMLALALEKGLGDDFQFEKIGRFGESKQQLSIPIYSHKTSGMTFHLIPGGRYQMGLSAEAAPSTLKFGRDHNISAWRKQQRKERTEALPELLRNEMPAHPVTVKAFLIAEHECLEQEWSLFNHSEKVTPEKVDFPKFDISWTDIKKTLSLQGSPLRLPSESEWEYACRATSTTRFYWGEDPRKDHAWHHKNSRRGPHSYKDHVQKRNSFGLIDMSGNATEWCEDSFLPNYNDGPHTEAPRVVPGNSLRVVRGGSWHYGLGLARSSRRLYAEQDQRSPYRGVRFALSLPKIR
ncbi:MAG: bifunctional serine/threonine-protein kinase/formylglycine-generating enzyme family protein [Planctomycetota bacterium]|nr:bifunctional serine/threonine-protein kinase/formylglycine-generating enzyme family protein [Planctomycetota bacterium]